jgi:hypothetical protein
MMGILVVSSMIVSYRTAGEAKERPKLGKAGVVAALLAVLLSLLFLFRTGVLGMQYAALAEYDYVAVAHEVEEETAPAESTRFRTGKFFHETVRYGGKWVREHQLEPMPEGDAFITGRIRFEERPVVGATMRMVFDSRYRAEKIATDEYGNFTLAVPQGEWTLNRIVIDSWKDIPDGYSYTVTGGPNPTLSESMYHAGPSYQSQGWRLQATKTPEILPGLDLSINADVELQWPKNARQAPDPEHDRIAWKPLDGAVRYQLQLHRMERNSSSTSFFPIIWMNTADTEVALTELKTAPDDTAMENEYAVQVFAFDAGGELLAGSGKFMDERSVILKGKRILPTDDLILVSGQPDMTEEALLKSVEAVRGDRQRLQAAETLAKEGLTDPARALVDRVKSHSLEERKATAMGLILTGEGRCEEARAKFEAASRVRGTECYPEFFTKRCRKVSE